MLLHQRADGLKINGAHGTGIVINYVCVRVDAVLADLKREDRDGCVGHGVGIVQCGVGSGTVLTVLDAHGMPIRGKGAEIIFAGQNWMIEVRGQRVQAAGVNGLDSSGDFLQNREISQIFIAVGEKQKRWMASIGARNVQRLLQKVAAVGGVVANLRHMYIMVEPKRHLDAEVKPQFIGGCKRGLRRTPCMEPHMVQAIFFGRAQPLQPFGFCHRRVAGQRRLGAVNRSPQRERTAIQHKPLAAHFGDAHTEWHGGVVSIAATGKGDFQRIKRRVKLIPPPNALQR